MKKNLLLALCAITATGAAFGRYGRKTVLDNDKNQYSDDKYNKYVGFGGFGARPIATGRYRGAAQPQAGFYRDSAKPESYAAKRRKAAKGREIEIENETKKTAQVTIPLKGAGVKQFQIQPGQKYEDSLMYPLSGQIMVKIGRQRQYYDPKPGKRKIDIEIKQNKNGTFYVEKD